MLPGNAILLNGVTQTANREIGVPRSQPIRFVPNVSWYFSAVLAGSLRIGALCDSAVPSRRSSEKWALKSLAGLTRQSQRRGSLLCGNPNAADEVLESRVGAPGVVVEGPFVEKYQNCFVLLV